jgi:AhpD family alkylhydroperoxidase
VGSRINPYQQAKTLMAAFNVFDDAVNANSLDLKLVELVKVRASQINGCASCLDTHVRRARESAGESEMRLYLLDAWRESSLYSPRERAALAWTEAVTLVADSNVPDEVYNEVHALFSDDELVELTMIVTTINAWNRFGVAFRRPHSRRPISPANE